MAFFNSSPKTEARIISVIGMHRSGTSCLAGSLEQKGLFLGDVHNWNEHNQKGNRENDTIAELNESVLQHNGGTWYDPPTKISWTRKHEKQRNTIIESFEASGMPVWGFKEPRALLTMEFWRAALPDMEFVGTYRHPYLVAKSLEKRDSMPNDYAIKLWESYNLAMMSIYDQQPFPVVSFDLDSDEYLRQVNTIVEHLALPKASSQEIFLDMQLKNTLDDLPAGTISPDAMALFEKLNSLPKTM